MHFSLLISHLPRIEEARMHYNGLLALDARPHGWARLAAGIRTALKKLAH